MGLTHFHPILARIEWDTPGWDRMGYPTSGTGWCTPPTRTGWGTPWPGQDGVPPGQDRMGYPRKDKGTPKQDRMGYPQPRQRNPPPPPHTHTRTGWGTPQGQVMLGEVTPRAVRLLRFPAGGLSLFVNKCSLQFIAEDYDKLEIQPQCGNGTLLKLIGPSHGYETHAPSLMVKIYQVSMRTEIFTARIRRMGEGNISSLCVSPHPGKGGGGPHFLPIILPLAT